MTNVILATLGLACAHVVAVWILAIRKGVLARRRMGKCDMPARADCPPVSILIPAWQERGTVELCITALKKVDYPQWEAILIAGGADGTFDAAQQACAGDSRFRVVEQEPRGKSAALNRGVRLARNAVVVALDADTLVPRGWLRALIGPLQGKIQATTGDFIPLRRTWISLGEQMERIAANQVEGNVSLQGSSIAIYRETLERIGGFSEDVGVGVDWDLNARLAARGIARVFCPRAVVYTERPATLMEYGRNEVRWRRAHFQSLFRLRDYFLCSLVAVAKSLYLYGLAWFSLFFTLAVVLFCIAQPWPLGAFMLSAWGIFAGWIVLRRAALAGEVAAYMQDAGGLKHAWIPPLLLGVALAACVVAMLTLWNNPIQFKGPRPAAAAGPGGARFRSRGSPL